MRQRLGESLAALRAVFANPGLRRLELAWVGSVTGEWSYGIALGVFAYDIGGAAAVGTVGLIRWLPSAVAAPFASLLADRFNRARVMLSADLLRGTALALAAVAAFADTPAPIVYALAAFVAVVSTAFQPAQAALLPKLADTPEELTAANVASSTIESVGSFAGPAIGGILLALTSVGVVFATTAATFFWSAALVLGIRGGDPDRSAAGETAGGVVHQATAGFRTIAGNGDLRVLIGLFSAQTFVAGALNVLIVVTAFDLLGMGNAGPGILTSAIGIGGLVGAVGSLALVGRKRLATDFGIGILLWGAPLALAGLFPEQAPVLILFGVVGIGNTLVDVAALTLLQRAVPDEVLARVFGVMESLVVGTIGLGAIVAPALVAGLGVRGALAVVGLFLPLLAVVFWRRLQTIDAAAVVPERQLGLLSGIAIFAPLPSTTLEHLARSLAPAAVTAGDVIIREGDPGDLFYVVEGGEVEVVGTDGSVVATLGPGSYFGEIALLKDVPRTATVRALTDVALMTLDRDEFIAGVTGHADSASAADAVIGARLIQLRSGMASV
jgi:MFS family permease